MIDFVPAKFTEELGALLDNVPKNLQYLHAVVDTVAPFEYDGVEFILTVSQPGVSVQVEIDRPSNQDLPNRNLPNSVTLIPKEEVTIVRLPLACGVNKVQVSSDLGNVFLRVGVDQWPTWLYTFGKQMRDNVLLRLQERQNAILSPTGSLLVERWFKDRDLLPRSNALHRLGMRMVIDGFRNASRQRSVERVGAAITGNNPVILRTHNSQVFHPSHGPIYSLPEAFSGNEFHMWFLDLCVASFITGGKYIENFPQYWEGTRWEESAVGYKVVDTGESHLFLNSEGQEGCSIEEVLLEEGCFDRIRPWVRMTIGYSFKICLASYPLDTSVEVCNALGAVYWDCETLTMEELVHNPDVVDEEDPTGDGWVGHALDGRFDYPYGGSFDTFGEIVDFMNECSYQKGPVVTPLMTNRTDTEIEVDLEMSVEYDTSDVTSSIHGPIIQPV